jgi:tetratricopeptide (TPR) repeat protein
MRARLLLLAAALAAFGGSLGSGFHFDDYAIFSDPALGAPSGWREIWNWRQTRPLTFLTFWANRQLGGENPIGYHAVNLALHAAAVLLLYECLRRLISPRAAALASAIFAVHPIQAEAVDYIWSRSIVLATALCLAALLAWIAGRGWAAAACFAAALLAKEEVAAFPLALWLLRGAGLWPALPPFQAASSRLHKNAGTADQRPAPLLLMLFLSLAAGLRVIYATAATPGSAAGVQAGITPWHYLLAEGPVIWRYLRLLAIPYGFTVDPEIPMPPAWLGLAAWGAMAALLALAWRRQRAWTPWLVAAFVLLIPSSTVFPAADLAADRRLYLPMLGFATAATLVLARIRLQPVAPALVLALTVTAFARTEVWMTEESLWREAVERAPDKIRPKIQLARQLPPGEALALLAEAGRLAPNDPAVAAETGKVLLADKRPAEALAQFGRALALDPRDARNYNNRGVALAALGQTEAARQDFARALALDPSLSTARENLRGLAP